MTLCVIVPKLVGKLLEERMDEVEKKNNIYFTEPEIRVLNTMLQFHMDSNLMHQEALNVLRSIKEKVNLLVSREDSDTRATGTEA